MSSPAARTFAYLLGGAALGLAASMALVYAVVDADMVGGYYLAGAIGGAACGAVAALRRRL